MTRKKTEEGIDVKEFLMVTERKKSDDIKYVS